MKACVPDGFPPHPTTFPCKNHKTCISLKTMAHNSFISFYLICSLPQPSQSFSSYTFPSSLIDLDQAPLSPHLPATSHLLMMEADPASCLMLGSHEFHCKINGLTWYFISKSHEFHCKINGFSWCLMLGSHEFHCKINGLTWYFISKSHELHCKINGFRWCLMPKPHGFHGKTNGLTWYLIPKPHEFHCKTNGCSWFLIPKPHKSHRKSHQLHCKILIFEPPTPNPHPHTHDPYEAHHPLMMMEMNHQTHSCYPWWPSMQWAAMFWCHHS